MLDGIEGLRSRGMDSRSLALLILGSYLPLLMFVGLAVQVCQHREGLLGDVSILQAVHGMAQPILDRIALGLTALGVWWGVLPVSLAIAGVLAYRSNWRSFLYLGLTLFGSAILNRSAKLLFHRERPHLWDGVPHKFDYAFPSGHAMSSLAFAIVLVALMWNTRWRWLAIVGGGLFVVTIGWTRVYLGVHYPSDILGGWMLELAWSLGTILLIPPESVSGSTLDRFSETPVAQKLD